MWCKHSQRTARGGAEARREDTYERQRTMQCEEPRQLMHEWTHLHMGVPEFTLTTICDNTSVRISHFLSIISWCNEECRHFSIGMKFHSGNACVFSDLIIRTSEYRSYDQLCAQPRNDMSFRRRCVCKHRRRVLQTQYANVIKK